MMTLCGFFAWRRRELKSFWSGMFYDRILLEPFKNNTLYTVGRDSIISVRMFSETNQEYEMKPIHDHKSLYQDHEKS